MLQTEFLIRKHWLNIFFKSVKPIYATALSLT